MGPPWLISVLLLLLLLSAPRQRRGGYASRLPSYIFVGYGGIKSVFYSETPCVEVKDQLLVLGDYSHMTVYTKMTRRVTSDD